jgi:hypothetical protein
VAAARPKIRVAVINFITWLDRFFEVAFWSPFSISRCGVDGFGGYLSAFGDRLSAVVIPSCIYKLFVEGEGVTDSYIRADLCILGISTTIFPPVLR